MRTISLKKYKISYLFNFLFLFLAILDPTRSIFHLTEVVLVLCLFFNCKKFYYRYSIFIIYVMAVYFFSLAFSYTNQQFEKAREISLLTSYIFLFYLLLSKDDSNKTFLCFYKICIIMSIIVILIAILFFLFNELASLFITYFVDEKSTIMFTPARRFLNLEIIGVFYRTSPMIVLLLPFSLVIFFETRKIRYFIHSILFMGNLLFSGTRANILSAILLFGFVFVCHLWYNKKSVFFFPTILIGGIGAAMLLIFLIITMKDASASVKDLHKISEWDVFLGNPIRTLFVGYGPGSMFYTRAWGRMTSQTELSYLELIRNYGVLGAIGILSIYVYPLFLMMKNRVYPIIYRLTLALGYVAYLFIAGTNPFLNCATGYLTVSIFYYMANNNVITEIRNNYG